MNYALKTIDSVFKMMGFALTMINFAFQLMNTCRNRSSTMTASAASIVFWPLKAADAGNVSERCAPGNRGVVECVCIFTSSRTKIRRWRRGCPTRNPELQIAARHIAGASMEGLDRLNNLFALHGHEHITRQRANQSHAVLQYKWRVSQDFLLKYRQNLEIPLIYDDFLLKNAHHFAGIETTKPQFSQRRKWFFTLFDVFLI